MPSAAASAAAGAPVVTLRHVVKSYRTGRATVVAVNGVSLTVGERDRLAIIGESGSGKSTIARLLLGTVVCDSGSVEVLGHDWSRLDDGARRRLRGDLGAVFQEPIESLNPRMKVRDIIAEPLFVHRRYARRAEVAARVRAVLEKMALQSPLLERYPSELSGGQAQRVSIARALIAEPRLLIFDEPTSGLDVSVQAQILALLERLSDEQHNAWVFVTHDLAVAAEVCGRALVLHHGRVVEEGRAGELLREPSEGYTRRLVEAVLPLPEAALARAAGIDESREV